MNRTENRTAINNMREVISEWEEDFLNKPHENQAKFRIAETTVYVITTFAEIMFAYNDVLITCNHDSLASVLKMIKGALQ